MNDRPYIQKTIVELQAIFDANKDNLVELKKLAAELGHRKVSKAVALAKKVSDALKGIHREEPKKQPEEPNRGPKQPSAPPATEDPIIKCEGCGQKLRIKLAAMTSEYSCPSCQEKFHASFSGGVLSVVFTKSNEVTAPEVDAQLTLQDAYRLFEANEVSSWEQIEHARRRLIQQYHPDKVARLGTKLRELAEAEGKRINVAYALLRKARGL